MLFQGRHEGLERDTRIYAHGLDVIGKVVRIGGICENIF
jgi:hypothetical protein